MAGVVRVNAPDPLADFLDSADEVYGTGVDGDVNITSPTTLSSDMFYNNLTIDPSITLNTNGYRVFVKGTLQMNSGSIIGLPGGFSLSGSVLGGGAAGDSVTNSLGGNGNGTTATSPTASSGGSIYYRMASQAIKGYQLTAGLTSPAYLRGGAGGSLADGSSGGGVVIVAARYIATNGSCQIVATGGTNAGGGVVILVSSHSIAPADITLNVSGDGVGTSGTAIYLEVD